MRRIYQSRGADNEPALKIQNGGTAATTLDQAADNLNLVTRRMIAVPAGVILLNAQGRLDKKDLPNQISDLSVPVLYGNTSVLIGGTLVLKITNYDSSQTYVATAVGGTVSVVGEDVIFVAGSTPGAGSVTVNGRTYAFVVADQPVAVVSTPTITSPVNGAVGLGGGSVALTASAFTISNSSDTHLNSDWEVSTNSGFTSLVASSYLDTSHLTSWTIMALQNLTKYYVRTRQRSSGGKVSDWSAVSNFTTKAVPLSTELQKIDSNWSHGALNGRFGYDVALNSNGNIGLISALSEGSPYAAGAVYYFTGAQGGALTKQARYSPGVEDPSYPYSSNFGSSVALSDDGDTVAIGYYSYAGKGGVYMFNGPGSGGARQAIVTASDGVSGDNFGWSIALSSDGSTLAVGAHSATISGKTTQGAVYIFVRSGGVWSQQAKLTASNGLQGDSFGYSVDLSSNGDKIVIGASGVTSSGQAGAGAFYVFTRSGVTWTQQTNIAATGSAPVALGHSVAISSDGLTIAIGEPDMTSTYSSQGRVRVYKWSGSAWDLSGMLLADQAVGGAYLGWSVDINSDGTFVAAGAYRDSSEKGAAFLFNYDGSTWSQVNRLVASDGIIGDWFGSSIAISSDKTRCLVGAENGHYTGNPTFNYGAAYVFA